MAKNINSDDKMEKKNTIKKEDTDRIISKDKVLDKKTTKNNNCNKSILNIIFSCIVLIFAGIYFYLNIVDNSSSINSIINCSILIIFTFIFVIVGLTTNNKNKISSLFLMILLLAYYSYNINNNLNIFNSPINTVENLRGKSLTEAIKWANKNNINLDTDFEYSDMVEEYKIISQDKDFDSSLKNVNSIKVSVSDGPSPYKEIIIPSMLTWDSERVINYVKKNYLNNVVIDFIESDKLKDTVIEQSKSGNLKRDEELKLTFSYGDEGNSNDVKLIDFTNKSKFEIEFYMKQHHLRYNFEYDFSNKIKKGFACSQSIPAGEVVQVDDKEIVVTISKGPKVKIPSLKNMSITKLTEWAVKNRLKLEFIDKYDDSVKSGNVINVDREKGEIVEQGTVIKVTLSRGKLKMPSFKTIDDFYNWADKYEIKYEVRHEFSQSVKAGEVISYSIKKGQTIKNDEAIVVTISDGENCKVPDLKGLSKADAISKLKKANLEYSFVYVSSDKAKDKVVNQSISSGSEVSCTTTITVNLSNGKSDESTVNKRKNSNNSESANNNKDSGSKSNNSNTNNSNGSSSNNSSNNSSSKTPEPAAPVKTCEQYTILKSRISSATDGFHSCSDAAANVKKQLESSYPGLTVNVSCRKADGFNTNDFIDGFRSGTTTSCSTISIVLAE